MVCLGNICRSPMAEGVLKNKAQERGIEIYIDSAGTTNWHEGELPDGRAMEEMRNRGVDISGQRSRPFNTKDFDQFNHILAMDLSNKTDVLDMSRGEEDTAKVSLILDYGNEIKGMNVPDPYYNDAFDHVYELLDFACDAFLDSIEK